MTTHELAAMLLKQPDVKLLIDDEEIDAPIFEEVGDTEGKPMVILWTKE